MFQDLCRLGRRATLVAIVSGALASVFVSFATASYLASVVCLVAALAVIFFQEDTGDKNGKTVAVATYIIAAMVFSTLMLVISGIPVSISAVSMVITGVVIYFAARFVHDLDSRCSIGLIFILMLPFGFLAADVLAWMSSREKKVG